MSERTSHTSELDGELNEAENIVGKPLYALNDTYNSPTVIVDPVQLRKTEYVVRKTNASHPSVAVWKDKFSKGAYGAGNALISVSVLDMPRELQVQLIDSINNNSEIDLHDLPESVPNAVADFIRLNGVHFIDGMHRGIALCDSAVKTAMELNNDAVRAYFYYRKDFRPMRETDAISIGGVLNSLDTLSIRMSNGDRCHNASATLFSLMKIPLTQLPTNTKANYRNAIHQLIDAKHSIERTPFRIILDEHNVNSDIINRRQRRKYEKISRGVFRFSTNEEQADQLEEAVNCASINLWSSGDIWFKETFEVQLFILQALPELFPASRSGERKSARRSQTQKSPVRTVPITVQSVNALVAFLERAWVAVTSNVLDKMELDHGKFFKHQVVFHQSEPVITSTMGEKFISLLASISAHSILNEPQGFQDTEITKAVYELKNSLTSEERARYFEDSNPPSQTAASNNAGDVRDPSKAMSIPDPIIENSADQTVTDNGETSEGSSKKSSSSSATPESSEEQDGPDEPQPKPRPPTRSAALKASKRLAEGAASTTGNPKDSGIDKETNSPSNSPSSGQSLENDENEPVTPDSTSAQRAPLELLARCIRDRAGTLSPTTLQTFIVAMQGILKNSTDWRPTPCMLVENPLSDEDGFALTGRDSTTIAWTLPRPHTSGFSNIEEEEFLTIDSQARNFGKWLVGSVVVLGHKKNTFRLFEDRERPYTALNPKFKLSSSLNAQSPEYKAILLPPLPTICADNTQMNAGSLDIQRILRALGLRPPHRSFFMKWTIEDYINIRRNIFHGIVSANNTMFESLKHLCEGQVDSISELSTAVLQETMSNFFRARRRQLDSSGFLVFSGIIAPYSSHLKSNWKSRDDLQGVWDIGQRVSRFFTFWDGKAPREEDLSEGKVNPEHYQLWTTIRDGGAESGELLSLRSRLMSTIYGATTFLEVEPDLREKKEILETRCMVEVILVQLAAYLRLSFDEWSNADAESSDLHQHYQLHKLFAPDTGGRLISTMSQHTRRQIAHLDFVFPRGVKISPRTRAVENVPYFVIVTSSQETPIWISEGSHRFITVSETVMQELGKRCTLSLFRIPPWSILFVRGDVFHAGAGGKETNGAHCFRFHMYLIRRGVPIGDTINDLVAHNMKADKKDLEDNLGRLRTV